MSKTDLKLNLIKNTKSVLVNSNSPEEFFLKKSHNNYIIKHSSSQSPNKKKLNNNNNNNKPTLKAITSRIRTPSNFNNNLLKNNEALNIIKSDIIQIENQIKKFSEILIYFQEENLINSFSSLNIQTFNPYFLKKAALIIVDNKTEAKEKFFLLEQNLNDFEFLFKEFQCLTKDELILKIAKEYYYSKLLIDKISDLAFLVNLNYNNEENRFINDYHSSVSNFYDLKKMIESFTNLNESRYDNNNTILSLCEDLKKSTSLSFVNRKDEENTSILNEIEDSKFKTAYENILKLKNISEFMTFKSDNEVINHISDLFKRFFEKFYCIFFDFFKSQDVKLVKKSDDYLTMVIKIRENFEKILNKKDLNFEQEINTTKKDLILNFEKEKQILSEILNYDLMKEKQNSNNLFIEVENLKIEIQNLKSKLEEKNETFLNDFFIKLESESKYKLF